MNWADFAILGIIAVSALVSVLRGFVREAISLVGWVAAFWVGLVFSSPVAARLPEAISAPSLRHGAAFLALLTATLVATAVVNILAGKAVDKAGLTGVDRSLGVVFGVSRGVVIVAVLVLLAGLTALPRDPWWRESELIVHFQRLALEIRSVLPEDFARNFNY